MDSENKDFGKITTFSLPKDLHETLQKIAFEKRLPVSRLICYALDNELEADKPFDYDLEEPKQTFIPDAYAAEGRLIFRFLLRYSEGMSVDLLCLFRRMIGIPSREKFLLSLRDLIKSGLVVQSSVRPKGTFYLQFGPGTIWIRLASQYIKDIEKQRAYLAKKETEINKQKEKLAPYLPTDKGWK